MNYDYINETALLVNGACGIYKRLNVPLHCHEQIELIFVASGSLSMTINSQEFNLIKGDFIAINSFDLHSFSQCNNSNLYICPILPSKLSSTIVNLNVFRTIFHDSDGALSAILSQYQLYQSLPTSYGCIYFSALVRLLELLHQQNTTYQDTLSAKILSYINNNYMHDIHLDDVIKHCHTNANYASTIIRESTHLTLPSYLNRLRLSAFIEQCQSNSNLVIDSVLYTVGFNSPRTFYRAFNKEFNMTPQEFIRRLYPIK